MQRRAGLICLTRTLFVFIRGAVHIGYRDHAMGLFMIFASCRKWSRKAVLQTKVLRYCLFK